MREGTMKEPTREELLELVHFAWERFLRVCEWDGTPKGPRCYFDIASDAMAHIEEFIEPLAPREAAS